MNAVILNPDGPHSPRYTRELGEAFAKAAQCLHCATRSDEAGLQRAEDARLLLGVLAVVVNSLPQLTRQIAAFLAAQERAGLLPADPAALALHHCRVAEPLAESLATALLLARSALADPRVPEGGG